MEYPNHFKIRYSQTRVKHEILRGYSGAWAGIITNGLRGAAIAARDRGEPFEVDIVYLDLYAGFGRYERDADKPNAAEPIWGSPIIATKTLREIAASFHSQTGATVMRTPALSSISL